MYQAYQTLGNTWESVVHLALQPFLPKSSALRSRAISTPVALFTVLTVPPGATGTPWLPQGGRMCLPFGKFWTVFMEGFHTSLLEFNEHFFLVSWWFRIESPWLTSRFYGSWDHRMARAWANPVVPSVSAAAATMPVVTFVTFVTILIFAFAPAWQVSYGAMGGSETSNFNVKIMTIENHCFC